MIGKDRDDRALAAARETVQTLFAAALDAVDPARAVSTAIGYSDGTLLVGNTSISVPNGIHIVAIGKAAVAMTRGALDALNGVPVTGDVITKDGHVDFALPEPIRVHEAGHPIPDDRGVRATRQMLDGLGPMGESSIVLALISGGGSALLEAPRSGVTLRELATVTDLLLRAGAPIESLNAVRAPLSQVKAGGLRVAAPEATWVTLILSDVLGNDPRIIASGPTVPNTADPALAVALIDRYGLQQSLPTSISHALSRNVAAQPKSLHDRDLLLIIGDNGAAVEAAAAEAHSRELEERIAWSAVEGEAAELGRKFVDLVANAADGIDVVLGGGEATVTVRGDGNGGRNTEFALAAALELERRAMHSWVVASLATDGQDAMTGWAGAIADAGTCERARKAGVDPVAAIARNDSVAVFDAAGGAVKTGPTGTNVNDLYFAVRIGDRHSGSAKGRE